METDWRPVEVRCRSDYAYAQEPRQVSYVAGGWLDVDSVLLARRFPGGVVFRVVVGGRAAELRYLEAEDRWQAAPRC